MYDYEGVSTQTSTHTRQRRVFTYRLFNFQKFFAKNIRVLYYLDMIGSNERTLMKGNKVQLAIAVINGRIDELSSLQVFIQASGEPSWTTQECIKRRLISLEKEKDALKGMVVHEKQGS